MCQRLRRETRSCLAIPILVAALSVLLIPTANAAKPTRTIIGVERLFLPAGAACEFAISGTPDERARQTIIEFDDGRTRLIGHASPTFTNLETGASIVHKSRYYNSFVYDPVVNDVYIEVSGRVFFSFLPGDEGPNGTVGSPGALIGFAGDIEATFDLDTGLLVSFEHEGTSKDLCELLR